MPTRRGWAALGAGFGFWVAARFIGSDDLHMVAVGIIALPFLASLFVKLNRVRLTVHRHLSAVRVFPGNRVSVSLKVENHGVSTAPFLLIEDTLPSVLGRSARVVVTGVPPGGSQTVSYSILTRQRGRYTLGPLSTRITDPFGLAQVRIQSALRNDLIVYPEVENLDPWSLGMHGAGAGESTVRQLFRTASEFYTMREYVTGDDLRRIHWPSVARTGQLMIRQDETTRRSIATVFLDNRTAALGASGTPGFERGVSVTATLGRLLIQAGFASHLATVDSPAELMSENALLEKLAAIGSVRGRGTGEVLASLRETSRGDTSLVFVSSPPLAGEIPGLIRTGTAFGRKLAVFIYPVDPATLSPDPAAELQARASAARHSLQHAGWEVYVIPPEGRLALAWQPRRQPRKLQEAGSSTS
jgi:uncharacterized protein (DUF58 family)